jgi:hypothetical protein
MLSALPNDTSAGKVNSINKTISTANAMMANPYIKGSTYNCYSDEALTETTQCYGASAIGDGAYLHLDDHVNGLSTLGRLGVAIPKTYIIQISDAAGKSIYKWQQPKGVQAVKADSAYIVNNMASDPNASYLPPAYKFHRYNGSTFAIKTGTTNDGYDGLMASWSSNYAVVSWVGNHDRQVDISKYGASMELLTEPLTRGMMQAAQDTSSTPAAWKQPADMKVLPSYIQRNHIHYGDVEPGPSTDLYPSWYTGGTSKASTSQVLDKVSGKVATSCTPDLAKDSQANGNAASWNIDYWKGGLPNIGGSSSTSGTSTSATDDVHNCSDDSPKITLTVSGLSNSGNCTSSGGGCTFTVTASQGTHDLTGGDYTTAPAGTIALTLNGQTICSFNIDQADVYSNSCDYTPTSSADGQTVTATVVDSVLYSGSSTQTVNMQALSPLAFGSITATGLNWSGGTGTYSVLRDNNPISNCTNITATTCTTNTSGHHTFYVKDGSATVSGSN